MYTAHAGHPDILLDTNLAVVLHLSVVLHFVSVRHVSLLYSIYNRLQLIPPGLGSGGQSLSTCLDPRDGPGVVFDKQMQVVSLRGGRLCLVKMFYVL